MSTPPPAKGIHWATSNSGARSSRPIAPPAAAISVMTPFAELRSPGATWSGMSATRGALNSVIASRKTTSTARSIHSVASASGRVANSTALRGMPTSRNGIRLPRGPERRSDQAPTNGSISTAITLSSAMIVPRTPALDTNCASRRGMNVL